MSARLCFLLETQFRLVRMLAELSLLDKKISFAIKEIPDDNLWFVPSIMVDYCKQIKLTEV